VFGVFIANPKHQACSGCPKEGVNQQLHSTGDIIGISATRRDDSVF
jgi:hypothetical protein